MFEIGFAVEVDPEFPGDGGESPQRIPQDLTRIGAVLRITPVDGQAWDVAVGAPNWARMPHPDWIALISFDAGYVLDVRQRRVVHSVAGVIRIREDELHGQVLLSTGVDLIAIGAEGIRWRADRLGRGDLKVDAVERDRLVLSEYLGDAERSAFAVDPLTGCLSARA